jgi:integrase
MKRLETDEGSQIAALPSTGTGASGKAETLDSRAENHGAQFIAARDSRNRRVAGLSVRNGRFYATLWADRGDGRKTARRFPLRDEQGEPIRTLTAAKDALDGLRENRRKNALPQAGHKPGFDAFSGEYLAMSSTLQKRVRTQDKESAAISFWRAHLANARLDRISTAMVKSYAEMRLKGCKIGDKNYRPASPRTVNLDLIALRNVLKAAVEAGHIRELPRFPKIKTPPSPRRPLLSFTEFETLLATCLVKKEDEEPLTKNGEQLRDFLRLLAFSGAREQEALHLKWAHVDFGARRIFIGAGEGFTAAAMTIGTGGTSKNRGSRILDFNPQLESLLEEMKARRAPDSSYLFPSPQRGQKDIPAKTLRESLKLVRAKAGLPHLGFHDLRHLFCSFCVMAGIDFMTIAAWLGHKDGGILVGKVYGHLLDEHRQRMAAKLTIGFAALPALAVVA